MAASSVVYAQPAPADAVQSETSPIDPLSEGYLQVHGPALERGERLPRLVGTIGVARLDRPEAATLLLEALDYSAGVKKPKRRSGRGGADPVVAWLTWQSLHARQLSLTDDQRRRWLTAGVIAAADLGSFPGGTVSPLLNAASSMPAAIHEERLHELARSVVLQSAWNPKQPTKQLEALRRAMTAWRDRSLVNKLADRRFLRNDPTVPAKVQYVLSGLIETPSVPDNPELTDVVKDVRQWLGGNVRPAGFDELPEYKTLGKIVPAPEAANEEDPTWKAGFEFEKLQVRGLDLVWVIDSTGSMAAMNQAVAKDVGPVMGMLSVLSDAARCGTVYVRHETAQPLEQPCCLNAKNHANGYTAKPYPLTRQIPQLAVTMFNEPVPEPDPAKYANTHPGTAVHGGMYAAIQSMPWDPDPQALHVVVMVADAQIMEETQQSTADLAGAMRQEGFQLHAMHVRRKAEWTEVFVDVAGGTVQIFDPNNAGKTGIPARLLHWDPAKTTARIKNLNAFEKLALAVLDTAVTEDYHDNIRQALVAVQPLMREALPKLEETPK